MPGKVVRIPVIEGQKVTKGDTLIVISAMKMESNYNATLDGTVKKIHVSEGDSVTNNQPLIELE
jgi:biotin carboxyl carrier protein